MIFWTYFAKVTEILKFMVEFSWSEIELILGLIWGAFEPKIYFRASERSANKFHGIKISGVNFITQKYL